MLSPLSRVYLIPIELKLAQVEKRKPEVLQSSSQLRRVKAKEAHKTSRHVKHTIVFFYRHQESQPVFRNRITIWRGGWQN